jgi:hypothetical protein
MIHHYKYKIKNFADRRFSRFNYKMGVECRITFTIITCSEHANFILLILPQKNAGVDMKKLAYSCGYKQRS